MVMDRPSHNHDYAFLSYGGKLPYLDQFLRNLSRYIIGNFLDTVIAPMRPRGGLMQKQEGGKNVKC